MTRILLADADGVMRSAMALFLKHKLGIADICEISDARQLSERLIVLEPDLLLVDWQLPGLDVSRICNDFHRVGTHTIVIAMSMHSENEPWALASGADAFLDKHASGEHVLDILKKFLPKQ